MALSRLLIFAAQTLASNPKVRKKAMGLAKDSWEKVEPKVKNASKKINDVAAKTSEEISPRQDPLGFAEKFFTNFKTKK